MPEATNYPLTWPAGWRRTDPQARMAGRFHTRRPSSGGYSYGETLTVNQALGRVLESLRLLGVRRDDVIVSSNLETRLDGLPRSGQRAPDDPGVAVYWKGKKDRTPKVMATDQYRKVEDNLAAIAATLDAMRAIERHGGAVILDRAFTGFQALPSPNDWRHVMGFDQTPAWETVKARYKVLAIQRHPDSGGSDAAMAELNRAMDDARRELES